MALSALSLSELCHKRHKPLENILFALIHANISDGEDMFNLILGDEKGVKYVPEYDVTLETTNKQNIQHKYLNKCFVKSECYL